MFNLANNVKVTWKEVPGAKYYKVYREGVTDPKEIDGNSRLKDAFELGRQV